MIVQTLFPTPITETYRIEVHPLACFQHGYFEEAGPTDFTVCGECFHVFRTEEEFVALHNQWILEAKEMGAFPYDQAPPLHTSAERLFFCPYCLHDL